MVDSHFISISIFIREKLLMIKVITIKSTDNNKTMFKISGQHFSIFHMVYLTRVLHRIHPFTK